MNRSLSILLFGFFLLAAWLLTDVYGALNRTFPLSNCSCSRQADSLYLINTFFPATNGPSWTVDVPGGETPWNVGAPLDQWVGVTLNAQGCVSELNLEMRNLNGAIPPDIDQLCALESLILSNNDLNGPIPNAIGNLSGLQELWLINAQLSGPIPGTIGNLDQLFDLRLSDNMLSGNIPPEMGDCESLFRLWLDDNEFDGSIPEELGELSILSIFFVDGNQLTGCVPETFSTLSTLNQFEFFENQISCLPDLSATGLSCNRLRGQNNRLTFDDILPNIDDFCTDVFYSPQDSIGQQLVVTLPAGSNYTIDLDIDHTVPDNEYRWFKDGAFFPPILNLNQLNFNDIGFADQGTYRAEVTNDGAPALTLYSRSVTINVVCDTEVVVIDTLICPGEVVEINGSFYGEGFPLSGSEFFPGANRHGCDSLVQISVGFREEGIFDLVQDICPGDTIVVNGTPYHGGNLSGQEVIPGASAEGCDSIINISLSLLPDKRDTTLASICAGEFILFAGIPRDTSGLYADTSLTTNGCDSIAVLDLTVFPVFRDTLEPLICEGDTFFWADKSYAQSGLYHDTLASAQGCDSIYVIDLTVGPVYLQVEPDTICKEDSIFFQGAWYNQSGMYFDTLSTKLGCDSILGLDLFVFPDPYVNLDTTICAGDELVFGDSLISSSGIYYDTFTSVSGCDSILIWDVTVLPESFTAMDTVICADELLVLGSDTVRQSGLFELVFTAANGCDSLVEWDVTVLDTFHTHLQVDICEGTSYLFGGTLLVNSGEYRDTLPAANGCDSFVVLDLQVLPVLETPVADTICAGDSLLFQGRWLNAPGEYRDTLAAQNGCDSILILQLIENPSPLRVLNDTLCSGDSLFFGGEWLKDAGMYYDTLTTALGCDSVLMLDLELLPVPRTDLQETLCRGNSLLFGGQTLDSTGLYTDTLTAANGCDSVVTLDLTVLPTFLTELEEDICEGDTLFWGEMGITAGGLYRDTLAAVNGCDSVLELNVEVLPVFYTLLSAEICEGDTLSFNNLPLTNSGTYFDTLAAANGCDSVLELDLSVRERFFTDLQISICEGEVYTFGGEMLNEEGGYLDTLPATNGCDSIISLQLEVREVPFSSLEVNICEGEFYLFGDENLTESGLYRDTLTAANGCDSLVDLTLQVLGPQQLGEAEVGPDGTVCGPEVGLSAAATNGSSSGLWRVLLGEGQFSSPSDPNTAVSGLAEGENLFSWTLSTPLCPDYDADTVRVFREAAPRAEDDQSFQPYTQDSVLIDVAENDQLDNVTDWSVSIFQPADLGDAEVMFDGEVEYRGPKQDVEDVFRYLICNDICPDLCDSAEVRVQLEEEPLPEGPDIPNAFTPNGDGVNDRWVIGDLDRLALEYPLNEMVVFSRWGDVVYEASPYRNDWDGRDQNTGRLLPQGTYYYIFRLSLENGKVYKGDITILK